MAIEKICEISPNVSRTSSLRPAPWVEAAALKLRQEVRLGVVREALEVAIIIDHFVRNVGSACRLALNHWVEEVQQNCI
jgi:hypothetical protein